MKGKSIKKQIICLLMGMTLLFSGCGAASDAVAILESAAAAKTEAETKDSENVNTSTEADVLANMKEFTLPNKSASLYLPNNWLSIDMGLDNMLTAGSIAEEDMLIVLQFANGNVFAVQNMDVMKTNVTSTLGISGEEEMESFEIPGMTDVSVYRCNISAEGIDGDACMVYGKTDYAYYAIAYVADEINDEKIETLKAACSKFSETPDSVVEDDATTVEITDTVRWFNASYAVLTELNGWDYNRFAGIAANENSKELQIASLDEWWGVTDRTSADENLEWILSEGHRTDFLENVTFLEECGINQSEDRVAFILENFELTEEEAQMYAGWYEMYEQYGEHAIDGWDYCRALNLMSFYYLAGYYTEQEALDKSLEIAQTAQPLFESWDDMIASYMRGYEYWAGESSDERMAIYEDLKTRDDNPYQVDYNTELQKTW